MSTSGGGSGITKRKVDPQIQRLPTRLQNKLWFVCECKRKSLRQMLLIPPARIKAGRIQVERQAEGVSSEA